MIYKIESFKSRTRFAFGGFFLQNNDINLIVDREQQKAKDDKSDEEMWVPSDLESDSEDEIEEGAKRKKTEDEEDSGGEFSSEGLVLFYFFRCVTSCTRTFPSLKGFFYMTPWHFSSSPSPLRFSLMALYSFTCYHQKILLWLSHTGTSSPRLLCRRQNFILPRDLYHINEE